MCINSPLSILIPFSIYHYLGGTAWKENQCGEMQYGKRALIIVPFVLNRTIKTVYLFGKERYQVWKQKSEN